MGALSGISGLADVQSRIATIESQFTDGPNSSSATSASSSATGAAATDTINADEPDFASMLASAGAPDSGFGMATTAGASSGTTAARTQFANDVLSALGAPQTAQNVQAIVAWAQAEGTKAANNPLATTESAPGATSFNSVGVKNYPTYAEGVQATVATLTNGRYSNILAALADGSSAQNVAQAIAHSPWGTGTGVIRALQQQ
ncbi:MAG TPA: hypothetical protein VGO03_13205 [Acidimicrobiia bacterium]|jgi:hypothetical protein